MLGFHDARSGRPTRKLRVEDCRLGWSERMKDKNILRTQEMECESWQGLLFLGGSRCCLLAEAMY